MAAGEEGSGGQSLTLGLDLGPTSIGWALIDEGREQVIATGVRVFPEGVDRDTAGGEKSKSQTRREKRGIRRQIQRRARRLRILRGALAEAGLLPTDAAEQDLALRDDPYPLRRRALDERLEPYQIGRVFYHLAQRRGFLSNRKSDRAKDSDSGVVKEGIAALQASMGDEHSRTLGEYLAGLAAEDERVRGRYTHRDMYQAEFDAIWEAQRAHHPALFTDEVKYGSQGPKTYPDDPDRQRQRATESHLQRYGLHGIIFFQRRVYWPASVIGRCELERGQKRCQRADRLAQRFRILQDVNNLRYRDPLTGAEQQLTDVQRQALLDYLMAGRARSFDHIRKHLAKSGLPVDARFNLERGGKSQMKGHETDAAIASKKCLGKAKWQAVDEDTRDEIVTALTDERLTDQEMLELLERDCGCSAEDAEALLHANLPDGHMSLSRLAIEKLIPFMEQGMQLMGTDATNSALYAAGYLPLLVEEGDHTHLGPVPSGITNPIVRQGLHETRKVVNAILRRYGPPDQIRVELAREAKKSFAERDKILRDNRQRNREREEAAERLRDDIGIEQPKRNDILKYRLWQEAGGICVYCGQAIGAAQLKSGEANVDHILPRWRSLDDSYMNKVVCHRHCNEDKGDRTPREWLEDSDPARYQQVIALARRLPYAKQGRFSQRDLVLDDFVGRHLTDTAYISRQVKDYMQTLGVRVACSRGTISAQLRRFWGLNTILYPEGQGQKTREDHRHHAVDAAVVALATPSRLQRLAKVRGGQRNDDIEPPWASLRADLADSIAAINVSHKPRRRLSGALHEETFYGPTQKRPDDQRQPVEKRPWAKDWQEGEHLFVRRKPVSEIKNAKHLTAVRDRAIRDCLAAHLRAQGVDPHDSKPYPKGVFEGEHEPSMPSGIPIRKVRLVEHLTTARAASDSRSFQHVQPGSNHHICYYETTDKRGKPKWVAKVTTMWDAALRVRRDGLPPVDTSDCELGRFVMSLSIGESFTIRGDEGQEQLLVVRKIRQLDGLLYYREHTDARKAADLNADKLYISCDRLRGLQARKVTVDALGRMRRSGD